MAWIDLSVTKCGATLNASARTRRLFHRLEAMAQAISPLYSHWAALFPHGNDHGHGHIQRVLEKLDAILGDKPLRYVNVEELFLTLAAIVFHDVGILRGRKGHPQEAQRIIEEAPLKLLINNTERDIIALACATHGGSGDIAKAFSGFDREVSLGAVQVAPRKIAALVRLADELDEDHRRADEFAMEVLRLAPTSKAFWMFCQKTDGIRLDHATREIVIDLSLSASDFTQECASAGDNGNSNVRFLCFMANKLAKIERERQTTMRFLPDGPRFDAVRLRARVKETSQRLDIRLNEDTIKLDQNRCPQDILKAVGTVFETQAQRILLAALSQLTLGRPRHCLETLQVLISEPDLCPPRVILQAHYLAACSHSSLIPSNRSSSPRDALSHLVSWYSLGNAGIWEEEGQLPPLEVYRMSRDLDLWKHLGKYRHEFVDLISSIPAPPSVAEQIADMPEPSMYMLECGTRLMPSSALEPCINLRWLDSSGGQKRLAPSEKLHELPSPRSGKKRKTSTARRGQSSGRRKRNGARKLLARTR